jgi:hypothetical protein
LSSVYLLQHYHARQFCHLFEAGLEITIDEVFFFPPAFHLKISLVEKEPLKSGFRITRVLSATYEEYPPKVIGVRRMAMSLLITFLATSIPSSLIKQVPGVLSQQPKHPKQYTISIDA